MLQRFGLPQKVPVPSASAEQSGNMNPVEEAYLDLEQIFPRRLSDTEYSDDTRCFELSDILHVDTLGRQYTSTPGEAVKEGRN